MTNNIFYYFYKIRYYDEDEDHQASGIVCGKRWVDTMSALVETYGELEMFAIDKLIAINDGFSCVEFDEINYNLKDEDFIIEVIKNTNNPKHDITTFEEESEDKNVSENL